MDHLRIEHGGDGRRLGCPPAPWTLSLQVERWAGYFPSRICEIGETCRGEGELENSVIGTGVLI